MQPRDPAAFLWDVVQACDGIARRIKGLDADRFAANEDLRLICERLLSNGCEAVRAFVRLRPDLAWRLRNHGDILHFRNFLTHVYFSIDPRKLWPILEEHVPVLREDARVLLRELSPEDPQVDL